MENFTTTVTINVDIENLADNVSDFICDYIYDRYPGIDNISKKLFDEIFNAVAIELKKER